MRLPDSILLALVLVLTSASPVRMQLFRASGQDPYRPSGLIYEAQVSSDSLPVPVSASFSHGVASQELITHGVDSTSYYSGSVLEDTPEPASGRESPAYVVGSVSSVASSGYPDLFGDYSTPQIPDPFATSSFFEEPAFDRGEAKTIYKGPKSSYGVPKATYGPPKAPIAAYSPPKATYGVPKPIHKPPKAAYGPPKATYGPPPKAAYGPPPKAAYGVPEAVYQPPAIPYSAPQEPASAYSVPIDQGNYGVGPDQDQRTGHYYYYYPTKPHKKPLHTQMYDYVHETYKGGPKKWVKAIVLPIAIGVGVGVPVLGLLFTLLTIESITIDQGGRGSSVDQIQGQILDLISRYANGLDKEECVEHMVCLLGSITHDVPAKSVLLKMMDSFVPDTVSTKMAIFKKAALHKGDPAKCKDYACSALAQD